MDVDEFWFLIEASGDSGALRVAREAFLRERLWRAPRSHLLDFVQHRSAWQDDDFPDWESLEYVACEIGEQRPDIDGDIRDVLSDERGIRLRMDPNPHDIALKPTAVAGRYPHLWALFGDCWSP